MMYVFNMHQNLVIYQGILGEIFAAMHLYNPLNMQYNDKIWLESGHQYTLFMAPRCLPNHLPRDSKPNKNRVLPKSADGQIQHTGRRDQITYRFTRFI
jgi:hypothetical protein